jgi:hypothetical protein
MVLKAKSPSEAPFMSSMYRLADVLGGSHIRYLSSRWLELEKSQFKTKAAIF